MGSEDLSAYATVAGVLVSAIGIVWSILRGSVSDRSAAARAEHAAALSDKNARAVIDALQQIAAASDLESDFKSEVSWEMTSTSGESFMLRNLGKRTAYAVKIEASPDSNLLLLAPDPTDIQGNSGLNFVAAITLATRDTTVTVTWHDEPGGKLKSWQYPLPQSGWS